jgi:hypothetical protein
MFKYIQTWWQQQGRHLFQNVNSYESEFYPGMMIQLARGGPTQIIEVDSTMYSFTLPFELVESSSMTSQFSQDDSTRRVSSARKAQFLFFTRRESLGVCDATTESPENNEKQQQNATNKGNSDDKMFVLNDDNLNLLKKEIRRLL